MKKAKGIRLCWYVLAGILLVPIVANAQSGYYAVPSLSVSQVYDDNVFFSPFVEEADWLTRVSPALEAGYDSVSFSWRGYYRFDSETYDRNSQLDSHLTRRLAEGSVQYLPNARTALDFTSTYTKTNNPADLSSAVTGVPSGRLVVQRLVLNPEATYQFNSVTSGSLGYELTVDDISEGSSNDMHRVTSRVDRDISRSTVFSAGYSYRLYEFEDDGDEESHAPWVGGAYRFSDRTSLSGEVGPRFSDGNVDAYVLLSLLRRYEMGQVEFGYIQDETTFIGERRKVEHKTASILATRRFGARTTFGANAEYGTITMDSVDAEIYRVSLDAEYRVGDVLSFNASYMHNFQDTAFFELADGGISRNVYLVGLTLQFSTRS